MSIAHTAFVSYMSLSVLSNTAELPAFRRRVRRLVDTVSDLVRHGPHTYAAFQARVDSDRPARDNRWDHFVDVCLWQVLARDPHPYNAPDIQARFAAGTVPFGVHLLHQLLHHPAAVPQHPVHLHHHHHHQRPHQHVVYPHPLPQQHPRPPQHAVQVPVPVPVPAPGRGAQQLGVSQGEARGVPPREAGRMGAPAAAPPLAVPQPGRTAAGSPPQTVPVPDPAVPRGAPPVVPTGPEPVVLGGGPPPTHGVQGAAPIGRPTAGEQAGDAAQEAAAAGPRDISGLLAQVLAAYQRTAAGGGGAAPEAPGRGADAGELIAQALAAVAPRAEEAKEKPSEVVASGGQDAGRGVPEAQAPAEGGGVVEPSGRRAKGEGVEDWMWQWREWRQVAPGQPCPAGLAYSMDLHAGTSWARLPDNLRARLDAAEAARGGGADEQPLAPLPPRLDTPPAMVAAGEEAEE